MVHKSPSKKQKTGSTATTNTPPKKRPAYTTANGTALKKFYRYGRFNSTQKEILCDLEINNIELSAKVAEEAKKTKNVLKLLESSARTEPLAPAALGMAKENFAKVIEDADYQHKVIDEAVRWQKKLAGKLSNQIENDLENTAYDGNKLIKYKKQAELPINGDEDDPGIFTTQTMYTLFGWYTSARLFFVRLNRELSQMGLGFLPGFFSFFGLSYILELVLVDLPVVLFSTFRGLREPEKKRMAKGESIASIYWMRFKNSITKDNRLPRMLNAVVWFSVNLSVIILTGGLGLAVAPAITAVCNKMNIGGFAFDVLNDMYCWARDYIENTRALKIINKKIDKLKTPEKYKEKLNDKLQFLKRGKENASGETREKVDKLIQALKNKINLEDFNDKVKLKRASRELVKQELEKKMSLKIGPFSIPLPTRAYSVGVSALILLGMGLFWFPIAGATKACETAGSLISLIGGSVLGGFGKRIMNSIESAVLSFIGREKMTVKQKTTQQEHIKSTYAVHYRSLLPVKKSLPSAKIKTGEYEIKSPDDKKSNGELRASPAINIPMTKSSSSSPIKITLITPPEKFNQNPNQDVKVQQSSSQPCRRFYSPKPSPENY